MKKIMLFVVLTILLTGCILIHTDDAAAMVNRINWYRSTHGESTLQTDPILTTKAEWWAAYLAEGGCGRDSNNYPVLCHSRLADGVSEPWSWLGENVGYVCPLDDNRMEAGFEASPEHLANMTSTRATRVGVGVATQENGCGYVVEEFLG